MAAIVTAQVLHCRTRPKRNAFRYGIFYFALPLGELGRGFGSRWLSIDRFNLFSFHHCDHGDGVTPTETWIKSLLEKWNFAEADGEIVLFTLPRILGYAFNPVSFWFCLDKQKRVRAVLAEVNNTFGERHSYLCFHDNHGPIACDDWLSAEKIFHVSPFLAVEGSYRFRFAYDSERIGAWINHYDAMGLLLATSVVGKPAPLTSARLLLAFLRYPLVTLKVIGLIHYQAVKLFLKGVRHHPKPPPPLVETSR